MLKTGRGDNETKATAYYIRTADAGALGEFRASNNTGMNVATAGDGGNVVPTGHFQNIIARRDEQMLAEKLGVRPIAGVGTTVNVPVDAEADGEFVTKAEMGDDNSTNAFDRDAPALGTVPMTLVKYTKKIELTDELLADEDSNLLTFIEQFIGRGQAKTHNDLLVTEALANGTAALTLDSASTVGSAEVPKLWYLLPDYYATDEASVGWRCGDRRKASCVASPVRQTSTMRRLLAALSARGRCCGAHRSITRPRWRRSLPAQSRWCWATGTSWASARLL